MSRGTATIVLILLAAAISSSAVAQQNRISGADDLVRTPVDPSNRVALTGHHPAWANVRNDQGVLPADLKLEQITIILNRSPQRQQTYNKFLEEQQNPSSPNYHHWLTPVEVGKRFGATTHDIQAVTGWLESQHLEVVSISNSRDRIIFSGPALAVGNAFGAEMHYFTVKEEKRISITTEPQIPVALKDVINGISGLYTVKYYPQHKSTVMHAPPGSASNSDPYEPNATFASGNVVFPADFAKIYSVNTPGIDGTGQVVGIVGRSRVYDPDIQNFEMQSALTVKSSPETVIIPPLGVDPGPPEPTKDGGSATPDQGEATLDVTRSGSIAPGATIDLVVSLPMTGKDGVQIAAEYIVDTNPVPAHIMSISFGLCEGLAGSSGVTYWDTLFTQAQTEGISVLVSSGDSAAAGCDKSFSPPPASQSLSPNSICASWYATCLGGTEFADFANPSLYWSSTNGPGFESALGYIPEGAWNEPTNGAAFQAAGTGGGVSGFIATPQFQMGVTGVPGTQGRYTPDIAFSSSRHDGYFACIAANSASCVVSGGSFSFTVFAGTSAAAPDMAGIAALLDQKEGSAQGWLNPTLYQLAANPGNGVFNDVTVSSSGVTNCDVNTPSMCNNSTPSPTALTGGQAGFLVGAGFDEATGLGSINVAPLLANWPSSSGKTPTTTTLVIGSGGTVVIGTSVTATATISPAPPDGETVTFNLSGGGISGSATATTTGGSATVTLPTGTGTNQIPGGTYNVTASYPGDTTLGASTSTASALNVQDFTMTPSTLAITVTAPGQSGSGTITFGLLGGVTTAPSFACSGLPSESTCTFTAASATTETVMIGTTAASSLIDGPLGRGNRIFYATLFPALLGLLWPGARRKSRARTMISFVAVLVLLMLWLPACSSSSSGPPHNPGTPVGQTNVTVTATSSTISHTITVNLNVQ